MIPIEVSLVSHKIIINLKDVIAPSQIYVYNFGGSPCDFPRRVSPTDEIPAQKKGSHFPPRKLLLELLHLS